MKNHEAFMAALAYYRDSCTHALGGWGATGSGEQLANHVSAMRASLEGMMRFLETGESSDD